MRIPVGLWIFVVLGTITVLVAGAFLYMILFMPALARFPYEFISGVLLLLTLFIISIIGIFRLKKWALNMFLTINWLVNSLTILFFTVMSLMWRSLTFIIPDIIIIIPFSLFLFYFSKSSVKELFN